MVVYSSGSILAGKYKRCDGTTSCVGLNKKGKGSKKGGSGASGSGGGLGIFSCRNSVGE